MPDKIKLTLTVSQETVDEFKRVSATWPKPEPLGKDLPPDFTLGGPIPESMRRPGGSLGLDAFASERGRFFCSLAAALGIRPAMFGKGR